MNRYAFFLLVASGLLLSACECTVGNPPRDDAGRPPVFNDAGMFICSFAEAVACLNNDHYSCEPDGEFLSTVVDDCDARPDGFNVCIATLGCRLCRPNEIFCAGGDVVMCNADGTDYELVEECDIGAGLVCDLGTCKNLCQVAIENRSYQGCEF
ncbi:MAG TPA: hypothetical protein VMQ81_13285, partial [Acidimicrobiia bacterium]|nr:hypothetical protein [Acidimicrobiia bacterium]